MRLCFSAPYDKIKKMEALPGYSIKHGGGLPGFVLPILTRHPTVASNQLQSIT